ncbi:hypothetical protein ABZO31_32325 [Streptomyces sp. HUAS MG47]|uniref:hypothetical protein n=1 Tax=Streptomyces solicamelliae TaxID=3231716 RepID=UPI003877EE72
MRGRSSRLAASAALTFAASALWSLLLLLAGGGTASAAPAAPPVTASGSPSVPVSVVGPAIASVPARTATAGSAATPATQATRTVRAEQGGRHVAGQEVSAAVHAAQPPLPPPPTAGAVATSYRAPVVPGPLAEVRRERAPPATPYSPRLSRGPPSPRSS